VRRKRVAIYVCCVLLGVWSLVPLYWMANLSFMYHPEAYVSPAHLYPHMPTFSNYLRALGFSAYNEITGEIQGPAGYPVREALVNSAATALVVAALTVLITSPAGYVLARLRLPRKNLLLMGLVGTRTLPPISIIVPFYIIGLSLGLVGNMPGLIIMYLSITLPLMTWVLMGFFASLPVETERAARIDGCTRWQTLTKVVFPMSLSGITAVGLLTFLMIYNEFLFAWILVQGSPAGTIQPVLASMWFMIGELNIMAAANVAGLIIPIIVCVIFQRYIMQLKIVDPVSAVVA